MATRQLLLDTHALIWWLKGIELNEEAQATIGDPSTVVAISSASIWEACIKVAAGELEVDGDLGQAVEEQGFHELLIGFGHAATAAQLPMHHRDPFDRMLIAQAIDEGMEVVTRDERFRHYDVAVLGC
ncbi:MAG: type II toxin-antitoxin system VapC family toxin [Acidimicrobiales bacterium]